MSHLQRPRQCPPVDASICVLGSVPCDVRRYGEGTGGKFESCKIKSHNKTLLYQTISHTFCP
ncbi:unnamed protein product [Staurois parvus]|uniref:Uncharacterized protein n=1 Tax=Staurois parvus TaxID=386267 RepID=A0ABN9FBK0_9NEOB|nr:unnamed protein product [Staurois parvus]